MHIDHWLLLDQVFLIFFIEKIINLKLRIFSERFVTFSVSFSVLCSARKQVLQTCVRGIYF